MSNMRIETEGALKPSDFFKMLFFNKNLKVKQVAEKMGKTPENLNSILRNGKMNMGTFNQVMKACDEQTKVVLSTGETVVLDFDKEPKG